MPPRVKNPVAENLRRKNEILEALAVKYPAEIAELRGIDITLANLREGVEQRYAHSRSTKDMVLDCLAHEKRWMRPREIATALQLGGFIMDAENGERLVVDSIGKMVDRKHLVKSGITVGLPGWPADPSQPIP
jgi:hypothetical protein